MSDDVFPSNDGEFDLFQKQFISAVAAAPVKYGVTDGDVAGLKAAQAEWSAALPAHIKAQDDARTATQTKDVARGRFEEHLRGAARKINATVGVDNATRVSAGLQPREEARSRVNPPTSRPLGRLEPARPSALVVHFVDEETPTRLAKPQGVQGCQIWVHVGDAAPSDASGYTFLALDTRTPYIHEHEASDAGKNAYYLLRWQNTKGEAGRFSEVVTAKIPG